MWLRDNINNINKGDSFSGGSKNGSGNNNNNKSDNHVSNRGREEEERTRVLESWIWPKEAEEALHCRSLLFWAM